MKTILPVENAQTLKALQGFLQKLLETGVVEALLVPMRTPAGTVTPALVTDPALLLHADPLAPVLPVNGARMAGKLSAKTPRSKLGVVLRSCEIRALVELTKMQQASLEDITLIAVDCAGAHSVPVYLRKSGNGSQELWPALFKTASTQPEAADADLRPACKVCEQPVYAYREQADIAIELFGSDLEQGICLSLPDEIGARLGYTPAEQPGDRAGVLEKLVTMRTGERDAEFAALRQQLEGAEGVSGVFAACIACHNCRSVCPICYCKTCVFESPIFDHNPLQYVNWARQKGAYRLPSDTMLFHLTRLNHMVLSCVGCGVCTDACPAELPVGMVFRAVGQRVQATFEYAPGRDPAEMLPLVTFKADEWTEVGE